MITSVCVLMAMSLVAAGLASASSDPSGDNGQSVAAKRCVAEKKADHAAFRSVYGKHAMRNCIKGTPDETTAEFKNAAKDCRAERDADPTAFQATYGSAHSQGRNAFGKCVSSKVAHGGGDGSA